MDGVANVSDVAIAQETLKNSTRSALTCAHIFCPRVRPNNVPMAMAALRACHSNFACEQ